MKHKYFEIKNFMGIQNIRLDFTATPKSQVYTFVGLNESGKTTILEAIHAMTARSETRGPLDLSGYTQREVHELIPNNQRANFNDKIILTAGYQLTEEDQRKIRKYLATYHDLELTQDVEDFEITRSYAFKNSNLITTPKQPQNEWSIQCWVKKKRGRKARVLLDTDSEWPAITNHIATMLPPVLFFPNFLFEFPDKIYLEPFGEVDSSKEGRKHAFYRDILQDVLDSLNDGLSLADHITARANAGTPNAKAALESVLAKMGGNISAKVFPNWNKMFKSQPGNKEIRVKHDKDENGWYLRLELKDGSEIYKISDRSLGFRWFFTFLLFTQYRGLRRGDSNNVLFLLDEPASNLHPSAQSQLLDSFGNFPANCSIIYTTHSHHMINPVWLEGAYVVKNEGLEAAYTVKNAGLNYAAEYDTYDASKTIVKLQRYREFASQHPDQSPYFQPILDVLDYAPSQLDNVPDVVMVEGKNDFYTLKYFQDKVLGRPSTINLMPGGGSGSLDCPMRLYLGWGRNFIVLLDSDKSGQQQRQRYEEVFGELVKDRIFLLSDINTSWKKELEYLVVEADRLAIQDTAYKGSRRFTKKHFNRAIQELHFTNTPLKLSTVTIANFEKILNFCANKLSP